MADKSARVSPASSDGTTAKPGSPSPSTTPASAAPPDTRVQSTALFRAMNFELYVKPNIMVMGIGIVSITACIAYIAYWNATSEKRKHDYMALTEQGTLEKRKRMSKWD